MPRAAAPAASVAAVRLRPAPAPVPPQEPADERCDYIPVPPIGYDYEGYPVEDSVGQSQAHVNHIVDWHGALRDWCRRQGLGEVFSDLVMPYRQGQRNKVLAPDMMVALRAEHLHERTSYKLWQQPTPEFALESLSNSTWRGDVRAKKRLYRSLGVYEYWLFDATGKRIREQLRGYRLRPAASGRPAVYGLVRPNPAGRRESKVLGLELCVREGELRLYDPSSGEFLYTAPESYARARDADAEGRRADTEKRRADIEKRRADIEKRRAEAERRRADAEKQRANTVQARAARERAAREAAEQRIAALEAQLRELR